VQALRLHHKTSCETMECFDRRETDKKLDDISDRIRKEPDEEKRRTLLILNYLISSVATSAKVLDDMDRNIGQHLRDHEQKLDEHEEIVIKGRTAWQAITIVFGVVQAVFLAIGIYGYGTIADLRDTVTELRSTVREQSSLFPDIKTKLDFSRKVEKMLSEMQATLDSHDVEIELMNNEMNIIKKKRAIRASK
jgi:hypothetical protein